MYYFDCCSQEMTFQGSIHHKKMTHRRCGSVNQKCALSFEINQRTRVKRAKLNQTECSAMAITTFPSIISIFNDIILFFFYDGFVLSLNTGEQMYQYMILNVHFFSIRSVA